MVSIFDAGIGEFLLPIFVFLLVYAVLYGILQKIKIFGDSKSLNGIIALSISVLMAAIPGVMQLITIIAPWFVAMVMIAFSLLLVFMFLGYSSDQIKGLANDSVVRWVIIIFGIIIVVGGLTVVYGPVIGASAPSGTGPGSEIQRSVFNPKVLTAVFTLIIFSFAVRLLSFEAEK